MSEGALLLRGRRILVTRARAQASSLVAALTELGAEVVELPTIEIAPLQSYEALDAALQRMSHYDWLIATSANSVRVLGERLAALAIEPAALAAVAKAAIGRTTAEAMRELGMAVAVVPEQFVAESLVEALGDQISGCRILLARASVARDVLPDQLGRLGAQVDVVDAYRTVIPPGAVDRLREVFSGSSLLPDAATFTSSSTVRNFLALWAEAGLGEIPKEMRAISIGPITSRTLRESGWTPAAEAGSHDLHGLLQAIQEQLSTPLHPDRG